jgi:phosphoglycerate kinase
MGLLDGILSIDEISLENQRVLMRLDLDVDDSARDRARLRAARATIEHATRAGARVVVAAHRGAPDGHVNEALSLEPVAASLSELLGTDIYLPDDCVGDAARKVVQDLRPGQVCLLENLDFYAEERENDEAFARRLASYGDVFVNDSLRDSRRPRASTEQLARVMRKRCMGVRLKAELAGLARIIETERPLALVVGGENAGAAMSLVETLLDRARIVLTAGTLGNTLLAAGGSRLQKSAVDSNLLARGRALFTLARDRGVELVTPADLVVAESPQAQSGVLANPNSVGEGLMALDIGPKTLELFAGRLAQVKGVVWAGALGASKNPAFREGTLGFAALVSQASAFSVTLGDDTAEAIGHADEDVLCKFGLVSTAGRAALELIEGRKLPGIEALRGGAT